MKPVNKLRTALAVWILLIVLANLIWGCRTVYVDRPYYVKDSIKVTYRDTVLIRQVDTVKKLVSVPLKNRIAEIDTKYLLARSWVNADSLYLSAGLKQAKDSVKAPIEIHYITNTPAPVVIDRPVYVYKNSDRFAENIMYFSGWALWVLLLGAFGFGIIKLLIRAKII